MPQPKTILNNASVKDFLDSIHDDQVRDDCRQIADIMQKATRSKPKMWGSAIVGFGTRRVKYADGSEREWMHIAFSPRKQNITLYGMSKFMSRAEYAGKIGNHTCGKGCLYIKRLSDIHLPTLKKLIKASAQSSA